MALTKTKKSVIDVPTIIGGADGQIQFNNNNDFGTSSDLTWDNVNKILSAKGLKIDNIRISPMTGTKNYLMNGNFDIWQRGTTLETPTNAMEYVADRWGQYTALDSGTISNKTYEQVDFPSLSGTGDTNDSYTYPNTSLDDPRYYCRFGGLVENALLGAEESYIFQPIEDIKILAGKTVALTFYAKGSVNGTIGVGIRQRFTENESTAGNSPTTYKWLGDIDLTTDWQQYELTTSLNNIKGKALVDNEHHTELSFWTSRGSINTGLFGASSDIAYTGLVSLAQVQLEEGSESTGFETIPIYKELELCRRYYEVGYILRRAFNTYGYCFTDITTQFCTDKRVLPSITKTDEDLSSGSKSVESVFSGKTTSFTDNTTFSGVLISAHYFYNWAATAEFWE